MPHPMRVQRMFLDNTTVPKPKRSGFLFPRYDARMHDGDEVQLETKHQTWLSVTDDPSLTLRGRSVALRASSGKFCAVTLSDPEGHIVCDQDSLPFSAWFRVSDSSGNASLKGIRGGKFCGDRPHGLTCDRDQISGWEVFSISDAGGGRIALRGGRDGHYCADMGDRVVCGSVKLTSAATFEPVTDTPLASCVIQTRNPNAATTFVVHRDDLDEETISLQCKASGKYLAADKKTGMLFCSSSKPWPIIFSRVSWWDVRTATFQVPSTGLYFKAVDPTLSNEVTSDNEDPTGWALWKVSLIGGFEPLRPLVRGVNLGNWFLLESWMANDLFYDETGKKDFADPCDAMDEYGLMQALGPKAGRERMEHHWSTWIVEEDIRWLGSHGVNTVRVPFGYWMVFPSPPFIDGQLPYLDKLFEWCEKYDVAVLLDFHGLKGSQTGNPTSGNCGACGASQCGKTHIRFLDEQKTNLDVIDKLTSRYSHSPAYLGFAVANEVSSSANSQDTMAFYQKAYNIVRRKNKDALVVLFATFNPSTYPFPNFKNALEDIHIYFGMGFGHPSLDMQENLQRARDAVAGLSWQVLVGEWSLGANGHPTLEWEPAQRDRFFAKFARMQLQAWESHSIGWFYWSYKTRFPNSTWNFRDMCLVGWLPGCTPALAYPPAEWWSAPPCAYAYMEGGCPESGGISLWWLALLSLLGAAAGAAVSILRPPWAAKCLATAGAAVGGAMATAVAVASSCLPQLSGWQHLGASRGDAAVADACGGASQP
eukprot:CAMPEP_0168469888 /NCGR_PEP_ID=MMETSP0228-20121227/58449_1 /TAXON_ID=133427 /ORGANISM="Protoceratium reticulatum, Strain CCCM 535 (=CCMP 1889)" /LENGTH=762 /DNA_ID=CAMNT_0008485681 /DNA_START=181 /DNA_END=2466 /DNA_ORIENTATION=-